MNFLITEIKRWIVFKKLFLFVLVCFIVVFVIVGAQMKQIIRTY